jgi:hypothetical protein
MKLIQNIKRVIVKLNLFKTRVFWIDQIHCSLSLFYLFLFSICGSADLKANDNTVKTWENYQFIQETVESHFLFDQLSEQILPGGYILRLFYSGSENGLSRIIIKN